VTEIRIDLGTFKVSQSAHRDRIIQELKTFLSNSLIEATRKYPGEPIDRGKLVGKMYAYLYAKNSGEEFVVAAVEGMALAAYMLVEAVNTSAVVQGFTNYAEAAAADDLEKLEENWT
jgi:hypothetical protein